MIRSNLSNRSRGSFHTFRRHRGITLFEVMMSVVLVAIGASMAVPSYRDMVEKRRRNNTDIQFKKPLSDEESKE